jgi:hypothetical protein
MKLTDENLDYPDCRPLNPNTSIKVSPRLERLMAEAHARRAEKAPTPNNPKVKTD